MKDSQILSTFTVAPAAASAQPVSSGARRGLVFDACHIGVVLRAVLFVEGVLGAGTLFMAVGWLDWLTELALLTGGVLPATLVWLITGCALKTALSRLPGVGQYGVGMGLGAACGLLACALLTAVTGARGGGHVPWLASAVAGALLSGALVAALFWRAKGQTPAQTAARLTELQARIRPHFLFNTLNSAIALVRAEPARAEALLEDLSDLFRHALADPGESVTLAEEIALARRYLAIEQVRFGERLRVGWSIDPSAESARLPPLLLQPLVENAVKHGVEPSAHGAEVRISTERRGNMVVIRVRNTVPNGHGEAGQGLALSNVRDRLRLMHDVAARFQVLMQHGVYQVRIEVPL